MQFEYPDVDFDGSATSTYIYDEAGKTYPYVREWERKSLGSEIWIQPYD